MFDMQSYHLLNSTLDKIKKLSKVTIFPSGLTRKLQPLHPTVNRTFRSKLRKKYEYWIIMYYESIKLTESNNIRVTDRNTIFQLIASSWEVVSTSTIMNGFCVCFGRDDHPLEIQGEDTEVNSPNIGNVPEFVEPFEKFTIADGENSDGFTEFEMQR